MEVNLASTTGWRPVHLAISNQTGKRSFSCLSYLLYKGADPSAKNEDGLTPMHQAASEGHVQCMKALIEAGADIDGEDARGHKPIDLAKLWGHKKCGRILAAEMWHRDKDFIAKEMNQLKKVKMQQVLKEIEEDEEGTRDRQFYGDTAFKQWLDVKALPEKLTKLPSSQGKEAVVGRKGPGNTVKDASLSRANSLQIPAARRKTPTENPSIRTQSPNEEGSVKTSPDQMKRKPSEVKFIEPEQAKEEALEGLQEDNEKPTFYNQTPWNKSPKAVPPEYVKVLPDHYPRDIYTSLPKYPPIRRRSPRHMEDSEENHGEHLRMPKLPADVIEKALGKDPSKKERRVVFNCENIIDVQMRKHYDPDCDPVPRPEIGLHMTNILDSHVFRSALQPERMIATPSTIISGISSSRSSTVSSSMSNGALSSIRMDVATVKSLVNNLPVSNQFNSQPVI